MGNKITADNKTSVADFRLNRFEEKECQTQDFIPPIQINTNQESLPSIHFTKSYESKDDINSFNYEPKIESIQKEKTQEKDFETYENEHKTANQKPKHYDNSIIIAFPVGLHHTDRERCRYNFWLHETPSTMKDFIEINSIPMFDLKSRTNFHRYCIDNHWYNTAQNFKSMWEAVRLNPTRILYGIRSKFDIQIIISDCFTSTRGQTMRGYSIIGGNKSTVIRAFGYFSGSWDAKFYRHAVWHNDALFETYDDENKSDLSLWNPCGNQYADIDFENTMDFCSFNNNMNSVEKINRFEENEVTVNNDNYIDSGEEYIFVSFPKNNDDFNYSLIEELGCEYNIVEDNVTKNNEHDLLVIKGTQSNLSNLKENLYPYLKSKYYFSEKLLEI